MLELGADSRSGGAEVIVALDPTGRAALQRDLDLVKAIALRVQAKNDLNGRIIKIEGYEPWIVARHVELMVHAGLLVVDEPHRPMNGIPTYFVRDLTNEGHDFVATLKTETVWAQLKGFFPPDKLKEVPLKIIATAASKLMEAYVMRQISGQ